MDYVYHFALVWYVNMLLLYHTVLKPLSLFSVHSNSNKMDQYMTWQDMYPGATQGSALLKASQDGSWRLRQPVYMQQVNDITYSTLLKYLEGEQSWAGSSLKETKYAETSWTQCAQVLWAKLSLQEVLYIIHEMVLCAWYLSLLYIYCRCLDQRFQDRMYHEQIKHKQRYHKKSIWLF